MEYVGSKKRKGMIVDDEYMPPEKIRKVDNGKKQSKLKFFKSEVSDAEVSLENEEPKVSFYYINANKLTVSDLKDGRRIFNNKTEVSGYCFKENFIEFRQILFENLLLKEDFTDNLGEKWTMQSAVFSTFCYDAEFIEPLIKQYKLPSLIIRQRENDTDITSDLIQFEYPLIDKMNKWGKFHSKLMLLKFPNFLRVVVPSANLTNCDWYYWGQVVWFQDFPLKNGVKDTSDFENYLHTVMNSMIKGYEKVKSYTRLGINIADYDFSNTCVDLISSASGRHYDNNFGITRLKHLTEKYSKKRKNNSRLIVQCSSLGRIYDRFLNDIKGCFGVAEEDKLDIIFPSEDYINSFPLGNELSGCLFLNSDTYLQHKYKFRLFELNKDYLHIKTVFHSKFIIACNKGEINESNITDDTIFYFGSHNLSPSAWGSYEKNKSQVNMGNYELGIIFDPIRTTYEEKKKILASLCMNLNSNYYDTQKPLTREF